MAETKIEWTVTRAADGTLHPGFTMNWWIGCTEVSPACDHCYAREMSHRYGWAEWGNHPRHRTSPANWRKPFAWNARAKKLGVRFKVFTNSLSDFGDNQVPEEWRAEAWDAMRQCDALDWLILTKRPENMAKMVRALPGWPWPHVWLGTTAENQAEADRRIPHLLAAPAAVRFLSCEPLLGPVDLRRITTRWGSVHDVAAGRIIHGNSPSAPTMGRIDWVICGGESGPGARPMHPDWVRDLRDQCVAAGVPFFLKQIGAWRSILDRDVEDPDCRREYTRWDRSPRHTFLNLDGGCGFHGDRLRVMERVSKKAAGATLDGREWREMPENARG